MKVREYTFGMSEANFTAKQTRQENKARTKKQKQKMWNWKRIYHN